MAKKKTKNLNVEMVAVNKLASDPANVRKHDQKNIDSIRSSLQRFGFQKPIVVDEDYVVRAGNGTLEAARQLGFETIPCVVSNLAGTDMTAYAIADNRTSELAEWELTDLDSQLKALSAEGFDLEEIGFNEDDIGEMFDGLDSSDPTEITEDEPPEPPDDPITKPGDLWILGEHRVLCGDSTKAEDVERVMGGDRAELCFTSPPYANQRTYTDDGDLSTEYLSGFIPAAVSFVATYVVNLGISRKGGNLVRYWDDYISAAEQSGLGLLSWNVWDRSGMGYTVGQATAMFPIEHEWIFVFGSSVVDLNKTVPNKHAGASHSGTIRQRDGNTTPSKSHTAEYRALGTVIRCDVQRGKNEHPAQFPVELASSYIRSFSGSVYDPFLGSGTTLIAAEQLNRKCYGMEISPQYCDVIVKRWENLTGKKANLETRS